MEWLRTHPYTSTFFTAGILIVAGIFIVNKETPSALPPSQTLAWGGTGTVLNPPYASSTETPQQNSDGIMQEVQGTAPYTYIPADSPQTTNVGTGDSGSFDFNAFIALLSKKPTPGTAGGGSSTGNAYAFIPGGFISTSTPAQSRTPLQQTLYEYGNDAGSFIQSFEQAHTNQSQILTGQVQDRGNADKAAAVEALGQSLTALGNTLLAMDAVPAQMTGAHQALAKSYVEIGQKLALVPQAGRDSDFIAAIQTYDASADTFIKNYVSLADLFGAYGVSFAPNDAGSVFTFLPAGL